MSNHHSFIPSPVCSYNDTEKCLFSFRVLNRLNNLSCCLTCFCDTGLISCVQSFEIFITHHIVNGPYSPWICVLCQQDIIQSRSVDLCALCRHAYIEQLVKLRFQGINLSNTHFLFDIFNNKFEYIYAAPKHNDRK